MASVSKRTDGRPGYVVRWRDESDAQRKKSFARKVDADRYRATVEHQLHTGAYVDPSAGRQTFRQYAEQWRKAQPHRATTAKAVEQHLRCYAYPAFGGTPIAAVRPSAVQAFVTGLPLAASTTRTVFNTVRAVFRAAVRDRAIGHDPTERITLPPVPRKRVEPLTVEQVAAIVAAMPERYRALAVVGAGTGLRAGELFGLQVHDVDFLRRTLTVDRQLQQTAGSGVYVCPPKTEASRRTVPLGQVVIDALAAHLAAYPAPDRDAFIFRNSTGGPIVRTNFTGLAWRPAVRAAGLPKGTGLHALRHFYASALIRAGLSVKVVAERLGHSNAAMTLNVYSHLWPDDEDRTRQAIDDVLRLTA